MTPMWTPGHLPDHDKGTAMQCALLSLNYPVSLRTRSIEKYIRKYLNTIGNTFPKRTPIATIRSAVKFNTNEPTYSTVQCIHTRCISVVHPAAGFSDLRTPLPSGAAVVARSSEAGAGTPDRLRARRCRLVRN